MGVAKVTGSCLIANSRIAWQEIPGEDPDALPILCLHSIGTGSREFSPLAHRKIPGARLILVDWPGHGRSETAESSQECAVSHYAHIVQSLIGQLGVQFGARFGFAWPILLGSGFGAAVAIHFATQHPDNALGLVLCQPAGLVPSSAPGPSTPQSTRSLGSLLRNIRERTPDRATRKPGSSTQLAASRQAMRMAVLGPAMHLQLAAADRALAESEPGLRSAIQSLPCPALFALSRENRQFPLRRYLALLDPSLASAPQHRFTVFSGAFHPIWDEPDRFAQALTSFVQALLPVEKHRHAWIIAAVDWPTQDHNLWKCVHPECSAERVLPAGENANEIPRDS
jgi:pimeloyl-ACP methyl ester carboxylesterase